MKQDPSLKTAEVFVWKLVNLQENSTINMLSFLKYSCFFIAESPKCVWTLNNDAFVFAEEFV